MSIPEGAVSGVDLNADGSQVALAMKLDRGDVGGSAQLWDWASHKVLLMLNGDHLEVSQVALSPDGKQLATAGSSPPFAIRMWDARSGKETATLFGHPGGILALAYSADGKRLATGGYYNSAKVWGTDDGRELLDLPRNAGTVLSVAFSPDGKRLAIAGNDWKVRIYALDPEDLLTLARSRLTRGLTEEECRSYLRKGNCASSGTSLIVAGAAMMRLGQMEPALGNFRAALRE